MNPIWSPSEERVEKSNLKRYLDYLKESRNLNLDSYSQLYDWSVAEIGIFWESIWDFAGIKSSCAAEIPIRSGDKMPGAEWFPGAKLNYAENLLRRRDEKPAIIFRGETKQERVLSFADLHNHVAALAKFMKEQGVEVGDRVVGYMPNMPETICAFLAASSIGAIWSSCSPDFGLNGVVDRFGQIEPKVLFVADGYYYNSKTIDLTDRITQLQQSLPSLEATVVINYIDSLPDSFEETNPNSFRYEPITQNRSSGEIDFEQLPFDHPLYILYSSGTTGQPKCIVHSQGGALIQHRKEHLLHTDLTEEKTLFYFTTCGWMMWNWLITALAEGSTICLFDGSPFQPTPAALFEFVEAHKINIFGTSAKFISALKGRHYKPKVDVSSLETILSTGSPLAPESYDYIYDNFGKDICLSSISGGTDIVSCFALGCPTEPVYREELQVRGLGMKVEVYDGNGSPVVGQVGELVCTAPFPSMPIGFWNDEDGQKYHESYFADYPNIWKHGDWVKLTERSTMIFYGRSDSVLNPGGVRIGTAEIYNQLEQFDEVCEAVCVGQKVKGDEQVLLFIRLQEGLELTQELKNSIKSHIKGKLSPRHVPSKIIAVPDVPKTRNGKIVESAVKNIVNGRDVTNREALANPMSLKFFEDNYVTSPQT